MSKRHIQYFAATHQKLCLMTTVALQRCRDEVYNVKSMDNTDRVWSWRRNAAGNTGTPCGASGDRPGVTPCPVAADPLQDYRSP